MYYSAFQTNGFQNNAYQIIGVVSGTTGGWAGEDHHWDRVHEAVRERREQLAKTESKLEKAEKKVEKIEAKRALNLSDLALQNLLMDQLRLMKQLEAEQQRLQQEILFWMREEDDIICLLYALPFMA